MIGGVFDDWVMIICAHIFPARGAGGYFPPEGRPPTSPRHGTAPAGFQRPYPPGHPPPTRQQTRQQLAAREAGLGATQATQATQGGNNPHNPPRRLNTAPAPPKGDFVFGGIYKSVRRFRD